MRTMYENETAMDLNETSMQRSFCGGLATRRVCTSSKLKCTRSEANAAQRPSPPLPRGVARVQDDDACVQWRGARM